MFSYTEILKIHIAAATNPDSRHIKSVTKGWDELKQDTQDSATNPASIQHSTLKSTTTLL